ncbi:hypothetical protein Bca52824_069272 [Brassica carinata]|uniref:Reverse transcriptase zinc-binding domain-containing protein n=1 Tax=Brassica carinata TaxID=52824 RepID=A0A8X7Q378_BRACI|nr:hypothetical protein Bca52824_069272 [Brassica carinata]
MVIWGLNTSPNCCLCDLELEYRDHLFILCEVSTAIWNMIFSRLGYSHLTLTSWTSLQQWLSRKDSTSPRTLKRLAAQVTIYSIWTERNKRLHEGVMATPESTFKLIDRHVRDVILGRRNRKNFMNLMLCWLRHE